MVVADDPAAGQGVRVQPAGLLALVQLPQVYGEVVDHVEGGRVVVAEDWQPARRPAAGEAAGAVVARRVIGQRSVASAVCNDGGTAAVVQADVTRQQVPVGRSSESSPRWAGSLTPWPSSSPSAVNDFLVTQQSRPVGKTTLGRTEDPRTLHIRWWRCSCAEM
jgi:hypothetical protein